MGVPYAEVIGDPIAQSKSPLIHRHWLATLGITGDYRAVRVPSTGLGDYLAERRRDPDWRGCNVTIPHKESVLSLLDDLDPGARAIGAVNCVASIPQGLMGRNTDIDGIAAALDGAPIQDRKAVVIGAGGGARAALHYLREGKAARIAVLVRETGRAAHFADQDGGARVEIHRLDACDEALAGASIIINASPLGMAGSPLMPASLLESVAAYARGATLLDMVYKPVRTAFLEVGEANGGIAIDGLAMLVGQARAAFELFFGRPPPPPDQALRDLIAS